MKSVLPGILTWNRKNSTVKRKIFVQSSIFGLRLPFRELVTLWLECLNFQWLLYVHFWVWLWFSHPKPHLKRSTFVSWGSLRCNGTCRSCTGWKPKSSKGQLPKESKVVLPHPCSSEGMPNNPKVTKMDVVVIFKFADNLTSLFALKEQQVQITHCEFLLSYPHPSIHYYNIVWVCPLPGFQWLKWRFRLGSPTNVILLVVTGIPGAWTAPKDPK